MVLCCTTVVVATTSLHQAQAITMDLQYTTSSVADSRCKRQAQHSIQ